MEILANNVNSLLEEGFWRLKVAGVESDSRNGRVLRFNEPVTTILVNPRERVLFHAGRDANPIFHLLESVWILAGRGDVDFVQKFNSRIGQYSDDGLQFNAAYGRRMRSDFGTDQLVGVINTLSKDPNSRQAVIQLWSPLDLEKQTLDKACNTQLTFAIVNNRLNLTVFNRSNDFWYGQAGANAVHFSVLQEFVAQALGVEVGLMYTVSNNLHLYLDLYDAASYVDTPPKAEVYDAYLTGQVDPQPIIKDVGWEEWLTHAEEFCRDPFNPMLYWDSFFLGTAFPMAMVSYTRKNKQGDGRRWADEIDAPDWRKAVHDWIDRREQ
ncbi:Thymidylate synthase/dCMP hydroxymethylase domain containing protein [uncultured Caudovirales phage]|uniref:Thymidylate synthase/dCMP hydroxymethylase domain containing protein n=1 Tax=uncultured Caudovirales phage TaxID=2100421 RepID=A0A6J5LKT0_9CAUD|nr:Thymidylate synthase/dCMP hydroxymethylase domain containing protein [uncultured Caudovirales phage]